MKKSIKKICIFISVFTLAALCEKVTGTYVYAGQSNSLLKGTELEEELNSIEKKSKELDKKVSDPRTTQLDMNFIAKEQYDLWNDELSSIWERLTNCLPEQRMKTLRIEQSVWNRNRKTAMKEEGAMFAGGSMQPMVEDGKGADLTRERVYELAKILAQHSKDITEYELSDPIKLKSSKGLNIDTDELIADISDEAQGRYDGNTFLHENGTAKTYITVGRNSNAKLTKYQSETGDKNFDSVMQKYGYKNYRISVYYVGPDTVYKELTDGPIYINLVIDDGQYGYFFNDGIYLAREVIDPEKAKPARTYLQNANDFIASLYDIGWKIEPIDDDKVLADISKKRLKKSSTTANTKIITGLTDLLGKDIYDAIEKLGPLPDDFYKDTSWYDYSAYWPDINTSILFDTYSDTALLMYTRAEHLWDMNRSGEDPQSLCKKAHGTEFEKYKEEGIGDYWVGTSPGDPCARFTVGDTYYYIALSDNGKVMPDSMVMIN